MGVCPPGAGPAYIKPSTAAALPAHRTELRDGHDALNNGGWGTATRLTWWAALHGIVIGIENQ